MFDVCADPSTLTEFFWVICYLTTAKHFAFYVSFLVVLVLLAIAAPLSLLFGFIATIGTRSSNWIIQIFSKCYINMVRGIPDVVFFLFVPLALDQFFEFIRHKIICFDVVEPIWQVTDFVVCKSAKLLLSAGVGTSACIPLALIAGNCFWCFCGQCFKRGYESSSQDANRNRCCFWIYAKNKFFGEF